MTTNLPSRPRAHTTAAARRRGAEPDWCRSGPPVRPTAGIGLCLHRHQFDGGHPQFLQVPDHRGVRQARVATGEFASRFTGRGTLLATLLLSQGVAMISPSPGQVGSEG